MKVTRKLQRNRPDLRGTMFLIHPKRRIKLYAETEVGK
jgi:hypothetical protein